MKQPHAPAPTEPVILIGGGGHAAVVAEILQVAGTPILGYLDDGGARDFLPGIPWLGRLDAIAQLKDAFHAIVAVGDNSVREKLVGKLRGLRADLRFATALHPSAVISPSATLGEGTVVMANAVVNARSVIGPHVILNTAASCDHDNRIHSFASLAPGARLGGNVELGERSAVGMGACLHHGRKVGPDSVIGSGSVVTKDFPAGVVAYGNPAQTVRQRQKGDSYL